MDTKESNPKPEWASSFNETEYSEFLEAVESCLSERGIQYHISGVGLDLQPSKSTSVGNTSLGLENLVYWCKGNDYKAIINDRIDKVLALSPEMNK